MERKGSVTRKTAETDIQVQLIIDGTGNSEVDTSIPFLDHMLTLLAKHGLMDLTVKGRGDISVDYHHLVEDVGICLGNVLKEAIGDKAGLRRYGSAFVPMDESLSHVCIDISGRPYLVFNVTFENKCIKDFDPSLFKDFFKSFSDCAGITLHINTLCGSNIHHIVESIFKAFGRALYEATTIDQRIRGVLSTKGTL